MSNYLIAILAAVATGTWAYTKALRRTGGIKGGAIVVGAIVAVIVFIVMFTMMGVVDNATS